MKKITAVLTQNNSLSTGIRENTLINIFKIDYGCDTPDKSRTCIKCKKDIKDGKFINQFIFN